MKISFSLQITAINSHFCFINILRGIFSSKRLHPGVIFITLVSH